MSRDSTLFDTAVHNLFHVPGTIDKLTFVRSQDSQRSGGAGAVNGHSEKGFGSVPVDIIETKKEYNFIFDVPGLAKNDIQVTLEDEKILVIRGGSVKRKRDDVEENCKYLRLERRAVPKFQRKFRIPEDANTSKITAKCENGELRVVVEKNPPEKKAKAVEVAIA